MASEGSESSDLPISVATMNDIKTFIALMSGEWSGNCGGDFFYTRFEVVNDMRCPLSECSERDLLPQFIFEENAPEVPQGELARSIFQNSITKLEKALQDGHYNKKDRILAAIIEYLDGYNELLIKNGGKKGGKLDPRPEVDGDAFKIRMINDDCRHESEMATILVNHVLRKLVPDANYCLDDRCSPKVDKCFCGCGAITNYDNTSIGYAAVFHGRTDAFVGEVPVVTADLDEEKEEEEAEEHPSNAVEFKKDYLQNKAGLRAISQATATCIVCAFFQQYYCKGKKHKPCQGLFPTIVLSRNLFSAFLYDSVNDILLRSQPIYLQRHGYLEKHALCYLWCILNCDFICPDERAVKFNSKFHDLSSGIHHYRANLTRPAQFKCTEMAIMNETLLTPFPNPLFPANFARKRVFNPTPSEKTVLGT